MASIPTCIASPSQLKGAAADRQPIRIVASNAKKQKRDSRDDPETTMKTTPSGEISTGISGSHLIVLDGLRGMAILLVMIYHFCLPHPNFHGREAGVFLQLAQGGWMGVDLFFVLSGFLITGILIDTRNRPGYFKNFLGRRFLRIWPLYYLTLLVLLVLLPLGMSNVPIQVQSMQDKQIWFWLYGANWLFALQGGFSQTSGGYFWSLAVEEQFYLIWPVVVYALSNRALLRTSFAVLIASLGLRIVLAAMGVNTNSLYTMTLTHLDGLAVGSCLAVCLRSEVLTKRVLRLMPIGLGVGVIGLMAVRIVDHDLFFWSRTMATYGYTFAAILSGALLVWVLHGKNTVGFGWFLRTGFMRQCGKYSYALYMVHVPVASLLIPLTSRILDRFDYGIGQDSALFVGGAASFAVSWILAIASWHLFEKHALALKGFFSYAPSGGTPAIAGEPRSVEHRHQG